MNATSLCHPIDRPSHWLIALYHYRNDSYYHSTWSCNDDSSFRLILLWWSILGICFCRKKKNPQQSDSLPDETERLITVTYRLIGSDDLQGLKPWYSGEVLSHHGRAPIAQQFWWRWCATWSAEFLIFLISFSYELERAHKATMTGL